MKLEEWEIRKNKISVGVGSHSRPRRKTKTVTIVSAASGVQPSHVTTDALEHINLQT